MYTIDSMYTLDQSAGPSATVESIVVIYEKKARLHAVAYNVDGFEGLCITGDEVDYDNTLEEYETLEDAKASKYYKALEIAKHNYDLLGKHFR